MGISALAASKWVVFISFPLRSLSFYYFSKRTPFDIASFTGAILYGLIPWHFTYITILGNPTYSLCFIFLPPLFKFSSDKEYLHLVLASISFSLITLSHHGTGFLIAYALIWYSLFSGILYFQLRDSFFRLIQIGLISIGVLCFFWMPYIFYSNMIGSFNVPFEPKHETLIQLVQKSHFMYLGLPILILSIISMIIVTISKNKEGVLYSLMTGVSLTLTFGYMNPKMQFIYPFSKIIGPGYRFNILSSFSISMLIYELIKSITNTPQQFNMLKKFEKYQLNKINILVLLFSILTLCASIVTIFPLSVFYNMPIPSSHVSVFSAISNKPKDGRAWWVPRGALETSTPMFTELPTPDGWYDQGVSPEIYFLIHDLADVQLTENPFYFVEKLKELSVKYLIVHSGPISESLKYDEGLTPVSENPDLVLFQVKNIDPVTTHSPPANWRIIRRIGLLFSGTTILFLWFFERLRKGLEI
ncbi:MAG: hypothetical protein JSV56_06755 [Methanomassiliicoccales archaeon]|nr:MAG: hypothetical protein JSV56_06755 [Methanomassiliicoccales archaeon]